MFSGWCWTILLLEVHVRHSIHFQWGPNWATLCCWQGHPLSWTKSSYLIYPLVVFLPSISLFNDMEGSVIDFNRNTWKFLTYNFRLTRYIGLKSIHFYFVCNAAALQFLLYSRISWISVSVKQKLIGSQYCMFKRLQLIGQRLYILHDPYDYVNSATKASKKKDETWGPWNGE